jgi:hypothetical protein
MLALAGCITQFVPETTETQELLVVEGLITDQKEVNIVKLSKSLPLVRKPDAVPLSGCSVWITDDLGISYPLHETVQGTYVTDTSNFRGQSGRKYKLHINTGYSFRSGLSFESYPVEMKPVPPIDSVYYEKRIFKAADKYSTDIEECQVYIDTHDPDNSCKYYRWDYSETWEFRLPFPAPVNKVCWITDNSRNIHIKSTSSLSQYVIIHYPLEYISHETDRLKVKYSVLVNQYSLSEDEFEYWEKLKSVTQDVGGLYDVIPAEIPNNIYCIENPSQRVLGYFSVSAKSSERIFIKENFKGVINLYKECIDDTIPAYNPLIPNLGISVWILESHYDSPMDPPFTTITYTKGCADCTVRGSTIRPDFWK